MKKAGILAMVLLCLCGCSNTSREIQRGMALRTKLLQSEAVSFDAEVTADYGDSLYTFSLACRAVPKGDLAFTVTAPETIAGITGTIAEGSGKLTFDDTALHFELMADDYLSPVSAPWLLMKTLLGGNLTSACQEDGNIRLTMDDSFREDALQLDIWLGEGDLPQRGEILFDGRRILSVNVKNLVIV